MGKLNYDTTSNDLQHAAVQYRRQLLPLVRISAKDTLQYMTGRSGIRFREILGTYNVSGAELRPYKSGITAADNNLNAETRELNTYLGAHVNDFEPLSAVQTVLDKATDKGTDLQKHPIMKLVLAGTMATLGEKLNDCIFSAQRNPNNTTTADLFDGFDTITAAEITGGGIATSKGNYVKLTQEINNANAVDVMKSIMRSMHKALRRQSVYVFVSYDIYDMYCDAYQAEKGALPYNNQYEQVYVEGSNKKMILVPVVSKSGSRYITISPKENMYYGYDDSSEEYARLAVKEFKPFVLTLEATMFFGVQFNSIDPRALMIAELAEGDDGSYKAPTPEPEPEEDDDQEGGGGQQE